MKTKRKQTAHKVFGHGNVVFAEVVFLRSKTTALVRINSLIWHLKAFDYYNNHPTPSEKLSNKFDLIRAELLKKIIVSRLRKNQLQCP